MSIKDFFNILTGSNYLEEDKNEIKEDIEPKLIKILDKTKASKKTVKKHDKYNYNKEIECEIREYENSELKIKEITEKKFNIMRYNYEYDTRYYVWYNGIKVYPANTNNANNKQWINALDRLSENVETGINIDTNLRANINYEIEMAKTIYKKLYGPYMTKDRDGDEILTHGFKKYDLEIISTENIYFNITTIKYESREVLEQSENLKTGAKKINTYKPGIWEKLLEGIYQNLDSMIITKSEEDRKQEIAQKIAKKICLICSDGKNINELNDYLYEYGISISYASLENDPLAEFTHNNDWFTIYESGQIVFKCSNKKDYTLGISNPFTVMNFEEGYWIECLNIALEQLESTKRLKETKKDIEKEKEIDNIIKSLSKKPKNLY